MAGTNLRTPRIAMAARASLLALLLLGCGEDGTGYRLPTRITISPDGPVSAYVGDTLTVKATIHNSSHTGVTYHSSRPGVAVVDEVSGLVTVIGPGEATITAVSLTDPRIFAEIAMIVLPDLPASLEISELVEADGGAVVASRISGTLELRLNVNRGNARRLQVFVRDEVVCSESYPAPGIEPPPAESYACVIDTASFDESDGAPRFLNGEAALTAHLLASGDRMLATIEGVDLTLANPGRIVARVASQHQAMDAEGNTWISGDLTIEAQPVVYESERSVAQIAFRYVAPGGADTTIVDESAPFAVTIPGSGVLHEVTDADFRIALTSVDGTGEAGPGGTVGPLRYDNSPPVPGQLVAREWIGAISRFANSYSAEGEHEAGVGRVQLRFFAGDPSLDAATIVAGGIPVTVGSDLPQAPRESYRLALQVCDGLDNCALVEGFLFGVDLTPPLVESFNIEDRAANPGTDMTLGLRDDLSGFGERMLEVSASLLDGSLGAAVCGPLLEGIDLPGTPFGGGCAPDTLPNRIPVPRSTAGYYTYAIAAFDRAGNRSSSVQRKLLVDLLPPTLNDLTMPSSVVPGEQVSVSAVAADDLDLMSVDFRLVYPRRSEGAAVAISLGLPIGAGEPFDEVLTTELTAVAAFPFVRTLTYGSAVAGPRETVVIDSLRASATDAARLAMPSARVIPPEAFADDTSTADPFPRFSTAVTTVDRTSVCTAGCGEGDPRSLRIVVRVEGESGTGRPFARLHFYRRDPTGVLTYLASLEGTDATITNTGTQSTFVYSLDHVPPQGLAGEFNLLAMGVTSRGNGLITEMSGSAAPSVTFYRR